MSLATWLTLCYGFITIICFFILQWISKYFILRYKLRNVPGPASFPFIGVSTTLAKIPLQDRFNWFTETCFKFKGGMVLMWLGVNPHLIIRKPNQVETILSSNVHIRKSSLYRFVEPWLGGGLITSTGQFWFHHRRLITPAFHFGVLEEYRIVMSEKTEILIKVIESKLQANPNEPINITSLITNYTLDIICKTAMGLDIDSQMQPESSYVKEIHKVTRLSPERNVRPWLYLDFIFHRTQIGKNFVNAVNAVRNFTKTVVKQKQLERETKEVNIAEDKVLDEFGKRKVKSFIDLLLDASENVENPLNFNELEEEINTFMFAGHDTTAGGIFWTLYAIATAPEIQAKVHEELEMVFGDNCESATTKQLNQLKYLERVIKEALRIYPSVPSISRHLDSDVMIDNYLIPKGTTVSVNIYQLHHDPETWKDPETFNPDRFLPENSKRHPYAYVPFSAGPRNCIGQKFAILELKTAIAEILRKWRISSVLKRSETKLMNSITLRPSAERIDLYFSPLKTSNV